MLRSLIVSNSSRIGALGARTMATSTSSNVAPKAPASSAGSVGALLAPATLGPWELKNHMAMAPMTRSRASREGLQPSYAVTYYKQRATAGLIITEGTQTSDNAQGYANTPGLYNDAHVNSWKPIVQAVHDDRSRIFVQLMHAGRIAHSANRLTSEKPVAPSVVRADVKLYATSKGLQPTDEPRALTANEIRGVYEEFAHATKLAISSAGFDGVELHAASGYLAHQFLSSNANRRTDGFGGSINGRIRFVIEALQAMIEAAGDSRRVGIKLSPKMGFNDIEDSDAEELYPVLARALTPLKLGYVHVMRSPGVDALSLVRPHYKGTFIAGGGYDAASGEAALANREADLIAYGSSYLANPDLPRRFALQSALNVPDKNTFYSPGEKGYTDYPIVAA